MHQLRLRMLQKLWGTKVPILRTMSLVLSIAPIACTFIECRLRRLFLQRVNMARARLTYYVANGVAKYDHY